jgi:hypothetical protein
MLLVCADGQYTDAHKVFITLVNEYVDVVLKALGCNTPDTYAISFPTAFPMHYRDVHFCMSKIVSASFSNDLSLRMETSAAYRASFMICKMLLCNGPDSIRLNAPSIQYYQCTEELLLKDRVPHAAVEHTVHKLIRLGKAYKRNMPHVFSVIKPFLSSKLPSEIVGKIYTHFETVGVDQVRQILQDATESSVPRSSFFKVKRNT